MHYKDFQISRECLNPHFEGYKLQPNLAPPTHDRFFSPWKARNVFSLWKDGEDTLTHECSIPGTSSLDAGWRLSLSRYPFFTHFNHLVTDPWEKRWFYYMGEKDDLILLEMNKHEQSASIYSVYTFPNKQKEENVRVEPTLPCPPTIKVVHPNLIMFSNGRGAFSFLRVEPTTISNSLPCSSISEHVRCWIVEGQSVENGSSIGRISVHLLAEWTEIPSLGAFYIRDVYFPHDDVRNLCILVEQHISIPKKTANVQCSFHVHLRIMELVRHQGIYSFPNVTSSSLIGHSVPLFAKLQDPHTLCICTSRIFTCQHCWETMDSKDSRPEDSTSLDSTQKLFANEHNSLKRNKENIEWSMGMYLLDDSRQEKSMHSPCFRLHLESFVQCGSSSRFIGQGTMYHGGMFHPTLLVECNVDAVVYAMPSAQNDQFKFHPLAIVDGFGYIERGRSVDKRWIMTFRIPKNPETLVQRTTEDGSVATFAVILDKHTHVFIYEGREMKEKGKRKGRMWVMEEGSDEFVGWAMRPMYSEQESSRWCLLLLKNNGEFVSIPIGDGVT